MKLIETKLADAYIIEIKKIGDERGYFVIRLHLTIALSYIPQRLFMRPNLKLVCAGMTQVLILTGHLNRKTYPRKI